MAVFFSLCTWFLKGGQIPVVYLAVIHVHHAPMPTSWAVIKHWASFRRT